MMVLVQMTEISTYIQRIIMKTYNLTELRKKSKLTVKSITSELSITKATLYAWENGTTQIPLLSLKRLLEIYGVTMKDLDWDSIFNNLESKRNIVE